METLDDLRYTKLLLSDGSFIPALGFGTLIPDLNHTESALLTAVEVGFRQFDCAERYRNENAIGEAMRELKPTRRALSRSMVAWRRMCPASGPWAT